MTLNDLVKEARTQLDDLAEPYLCSDDDLKSYANRAVEEACLRANLLLDSSSDICVIPVVAGEADYEYSSLIHSIRRVAYDGKPLERTGKDVLDSGSYRWETRVGKPTAFVLDMDKQRLRFDFIPEVDAEIKLTVYRLPLVKMSEDTDRPEIPSHYHFDLVHWIKHLAYSRDDTDVYNKQLMRDTEMDFIRVFGERPNAQWDMHRLRGRRNRAKAHFI